MKKANVLSVWWFLVLALITVAIVLSASVFTSKKLDARELEASVLSGQLYRCLEKNIIQLMNGGDLFELCSFNKEVLLNQEYHINISIYDKSNILKKEIIYGPVVFEVQCSISRDTAAKSFPRCSEIETEIQGNKVIIKAGSNAEVNRL